MEVRHYLTADGLDPAQMWLDGLRDETSRVVVLRRLDRIARGNFGDHKFCRDGIWELRIDYGPGFRVYYAQAGKTLVLLLCAGDKRTQAVDIKMAVKYWSDYRQRQT